jgi:isoaspartyl peptidase/L-asparaginase-like protein (Ntn-hydrolase superfamily)
LIDPPSLCNAAIKSRAHAMTEPVVIATWAFGQIAARAALVEFKRRSSALDAAVAGAQAVEDDPAVMSVGYGGLPNALGTVQLDACVMEGTTLGCGGVAALENIRHAAAVARRVMQRTPHLLLVGAGAREFAEREGFAPENLLTPASFAEWERRKGAAEVAKNDRPPQRAEPSRTRKTASKTSKSKTLPRPPLSHDTVAVLAQDRRGKLAGACTTSGLALKLPGRVGDSPLIGAGLYVDDTAGAAAGTGVGEEIIRAGGSILVVELMRSGNSPQEACEAIIRRAVEGAARRRTAPAQIALIALDPQGRVGAACTVGPNFQYAVGRRGEVELLSAAVIGGA